jgi:transcription antitermination factor NusA-like protein
MDLMNQLPEPETVYLYIPNVAVGAIIGTKGSYIKNIIKLSGASVKITPLSPEESKNALDRQVLIVGTPDSQWKAQYYIYEKIRQERFSTEENVKLRAEIQVPSHIVGRIIGKSGKNVRELQRTTGATIKLPEDSTSNISATQQPTQESSQQQDQQQASTGTQPPATGSEQGLQSPKLEPTEPSIATSQTPTDTEANENKETPELSPNNSQTNVSAQNGLNNSQSYVTVRIFGTFQASQCAQRRILSLVNQSSRGTVANLVNHQIPSIPPIPLINHYHREFNHGPRINGGMGGGGNGSGNNPPFNRRRQNHQKDVPPGQHQQQQQGSFTNGTNNGSVVNNGSSSSNSITTPTTNQPQPQSASLNNSLSEQATGAAATVAPSTPVATTQSSAPQQQTHSPSVNSTQPLVAAASS